MKKRFGFVKRMVTVTMAAMMLTTTLAATTVSAYTDPYAMSHGNRNGSTPGPCDPSQAVSSVSYAPSNSVGGGMYTVSGTSNYLALRNACAYARENEIGRIFNGDTVQLVDSSCGGTGYWYVYSPTLGMYGYVNKSYLQGSSNYTTPQAPATQTSAATYRVSGTSNYLALRTACAYDSSNEIGKIYNGDTVQLVDSSCGATGYWLYILQLLECQDM